jgi:hypothetical protein
MASLNCWRSFHSARPSESSRLASALMCSAGWTVPTRAGLDDDTLGSSQSNVASVHSNRSKLREPRDLVRGAPQPAGFRRPASRRCTRAATRTQLPLVRCLSHLRDSSSIYPTGVLAKPHCPPCPIVYASFNLLRSDHADNPPANEPLRLGHPGTVPEMWRELGRDIRPAAA